MVAPSEQTHVLAIGQPDLAVNIRQFYDFKPRHPMCGGVKLEVDA